MVKAKDIMTRKVMTVTPETDIAEAANRLLKHHINGLPVVDAKGRLVGILCQSDLIAQQKRIRLPSLFTLLDGFIPLTSTRHLEEELRKISAAKVQQAMTEDPVTVTPETSVEDIATLMVEKGYHTLPVVDGGRLVGVVGKSDVLRTLSESVSGPDAEDG
jgi:CBS-domain-containing membrane protein